MLDLVYLVIPVSIMVLWLGMAAGLRVGRGRLIEPEDRMLLGVGVAGLGVWTVAALLEGTIGGNAAGRALTLFSVCAYFVVIGMGAWLWFRRPLDRVLKVHLGRIIVALLALTAATLITLGMGFLWSGFATPFDVASERYVSLPPDHRIPSMFADGLRNGAVPAPLLGDWYSADRPPLQTGINLLFGDVATRLTPIGLTATDGIIAIMSQLLFIVALVRLGRRITGSGLPGAIAGITVALMPPMAIYAFFPWPKLLAAAFLVTAFSIATDLLREHAPDDWQRFALVGLAVALGLLSHGGSLFPAIGIGIVVLAVIIRRRDGLARAAGKLAVAAAGVLVPYSIWVAYGQLTGEDRGRLIKWHFAGQVAPSEESAFSTLTTAYAALTPSQWLEFRIANVRAYITNENAPTSFGDAVDRFAAVAPWRLIEFQITLYAGIVAILWLAVLAAVLILARKRLSGDGNVIGLAVIWLFASLAFWAILMFSPGSTVPHQGSPITIFLPVGLLAIVVAAIRPWVAIATLIPQAAYFVYISAPPNQASFGLVLENRPSGFALTVIALGIAAAIATLILARQAQASRVGP